MNGISVRDFKNHVIDFLMREQDVLVEEEGRRERHQAKMSDDIPSIYSRWHDEQIINHKLTREFICGRRRYLATYYNETNNIVIKLVSVELVGDIRLAADVPKDIVLDENWEYKIVEPENNLESSDDVVTAKKINDYINDKVILSTFGVTDNDIRKHLKETKN